MPRLVWLTDLHLNFALEEQISSLAAEIRRAAPAAVLIGGDLGEAFSWDRYLHQLDDLLKLPIYFVLGNHDYYGSSLYEVRQRAGQMTRTHERMHWLPASGVVSLDERTALVGHGGWGDARAANFRRSNVLLNDYFLIAELKAAAGIPRNVKTCWGGDPAQVLNAGLESQLNELGDETARYFEEVLPRALADHEQVTVLMHVPPFRESCWYDGRISDENWAPHFCCIAAGEALKELMTTWPDRRMTVLCGHTHGRGEARILPNLEVRTGGAKYGNPAIGCIMETDSLD